MNKSKLVLPSPILGSRCAPKLKGVTPAGSSILVEMLNADEALGTTLYVKNDSNVGAPQGYILAFGPSLKQDEIHLKVGDRVLLQGTFVPVPNFDESKRQRGLVEIHNIKAVFEEVKAEVEAVAE